MHISRKIIVLTNLANYTTKLTLAEEAHIDNNGVKRRKPLIGNIFNQKQLLNSHILLRPMFGNAPPKTITLLL